MDPHNGTKALHVTQMVYFRMLFPDDVLREVMRLTLGVARKARTEARQTCMLATSHCTESNNIQFRLRSDNTLNWNHLPSVLVSGSSNRRLSVTAVLYANGCQSMRRLLDTSYLMVGQKAGVRSRSSLCPHGTLLCRHTHTLGVEMRVTTGRRTLQHVRAHQTSYCGRRPRSSTSPTS
jgi:hypothetical protein